MNIEDRIESSIESNSKNKSHIPSVTLFIMRADLKKFWGIISGKQEKPKPRLRSTSLPRITSYGLIGFGTIECDVKERKCVPMWYEYDLGKKCNTFPRRSTKQKRHANITGRDRSSSVSGEVQPAASPKHHRRDSATRHFNIDVDETINEEDVDELKTDLSASEETAKKDKKTLTTVLCSTDL
ncbi:hypothetical protein AC249_AIPGENE19811 [Exaiptasia diaphana]|nr:hypothetical protein AC249_AIPGENE19811 [Exaiptasia diaphana]